MKTNKKMNIKEVYKKFPELKKLAIIGLKYLDGATHNLHIKDEEAGIEFDVKNISILDGTDNFPNTSIEDKDFANCYVIKGKKKIKIFEEQDEVSNDEFLTYLSETFYSSEEYENLIYEYDSARKIQKNFEDKYNVELHFDSCLDNPVMIFSKDEEYGHTPIYEMSIETENVNDMTENYNIWTRQKLENLKEKKKEIDNLIKSMKVVKI